MKTGNMTKILSKSAIITDVIHCNQKSMSHVCKMRWRVYFDSSGGFVLQWELYLSVIWVIYNVKCNCISSAFRRSSIKLDALYLFIHPKILRVLSVCPGTVLGTDCYLSYFHWPRALGIIFCLLEKTGAQSYLVTCSYHAVWKGWSQGKWYWHMIDISLGFWFSK